MPPSIRLGETTLKSVKTKGPSGSSKGTLYSDMQHCPLEKPNTSESPVDGDIPAGVKVNGQEQGTAS